MIFPHSFLGESSMQALDTFNTAVVSPIYYVMFTSLTILASVIMFKVISPLVSITYISHWNILVIYQFSPSCPVVSLELNFLFRPISVFWCTICILCFLPIGGHQIWLCLFSFLSVREIRELDKHWVDHDLEQNLFYRLVSLYPWVLRISIELNISNRKTIY